MEGSRGTGELAYDPLVTELQKAAEIQTVNFLCKGLTSDCSSGCERWRTEKTDNGKPASTLTGVRVIGNFRQLQGQTQPSE